ncbi:MULTISPECIES: hypothetical protein [unclassified Spirosoma]|uniref:hypothetical protein n=1 Tax=unclassified Spirosoma TaxID=2621999 RepID=UPI000963A6F1|nr:MULTISPECIES: hypothetical protein [unclassified Spirosoma]MBN8823822.1 hypothetical protein [Spirosoma sp.]OJW79781.1 MAG: hypothetical protein BGO59_00590 [Spirosoma sp. 48-14]
MKFFATTDRLSAFSASVDYTKPYRQYFISICAVYLLVAGWLAIRVRFGVMDELFHLEYSLPFAKSGLTKTTLYRHVPPTGVASHLWFALWIWLFPTIDYIGLRLITCMALAGLAVATYVHLRSFSGVWQRRILAASVFTLVCPYFFLSVSTVMTEGPSLVFLFAGLLLLSVSRLERLFPFFLACCLLGLTTIARFYYIPLLPALFVVLAVEDWERYRQIGVKAFTTHRILFYVSIGISLLPLAGLVSLWGGFTPPLFHQWSKLRSGVSFNALRPISAFILTGIYIAPIVWLSGFRYLKSALSIVIGSFMLALILALLQINLLRDPESVNDVFSGPIEHGLGWLMAKGQLAISLGLLVVYTLGFVSLVIVIQQLFQILMAEGFVDKGLVFSIAFVALFIASQAFIGGNHPFFERYLIHPWPFIGYGLIRAFPESTNIKTYAVLAVYTVVSVLLLTKWGLS